MSNFYLSGKNEDKRELLVINERFFNQGVEITPITINYEQLYMKSKKYIIDKTCEFIETYNDDNINLICQGVGCNLGISIATLMRLHRLILVSPEFIDSSLEEKTRISNYSYGSLENQDILKSPNLKSFILASRSKKWAKKDIDILKNNGIETLFLYSAGDINIAQNYIEQLTDSHNISRFVVAGTSHNPLLKKNYGINKIKRFIS